MFASDHFCSLNSNPRPLSGDALGGCIALSRFLAPFGLQSPQGKNQPLVESEPPLKIEHGSQKLQFAVKKNILEPRAQFFLEVYLSMYIS